jgi:mono/diheme cytochrome c family protein
VRERPSNVTDHSRMTAPMRSLLFPLAACLALTVVLPCAGKAADARPATPRETEFFEKQIRPLLVENCFSCHGPIKQKAGLRLDSPAALHKGGLTGPGLKPGDPDNSLLIQAVRQTGELKMPPSRKLKPEQVAALTAWVKSGAPWPANTSATDANAEAWKKHWAFQPIANPPIPMVKERPWVQTPLDHFVLAKLELKGLHPSPVADRRTLQRRMTFDLTGLAPTPEEIASFEADQAPGAAARLVDRLLASPHYGERWGRYWLDVARYADTKGYVFFQEKEFPWAYTYRDYVIRSFNEDLPYDQFVVQQLAADRLPLGKDKRPLAALGFLTLGGRFMNNQQDILDDRIDVVTRGLLGLTVTCARCHDHKFDPIPTADYYSLYGVMASSVEPVVPPLLQDPPKTEVYAAFVKEMKVREQKLADFLNGKFTQLVTEARTRSAAYMMAANVMRDHPSADDFMLIADGGDLNPSMIARWKDYLDRTRKTRHPVFAPWHALAALPEKAFADKAPAVIEQILKAGPDPINPLAAKALTEKPPRTLAETAERYSTLLNGVEKRWQDLLKEAASAQRPPPMSLPTAAEEEVRQVFHGPDGPPNVARSQFDDLRLLPDRASQGKLQELLKAVEQWRATGPGAPPRAMALEDAAIPYEPHVFKRGNPNLVGEAVPRQFPRVLAGEKRQPFQQGSGRLEMAQAIADRNNPLTARVLVNRVWQHHFGAALVGTPSDFGLRSDPPSHPELLDYLATYFMDNGWSIKKLHRLILLSAVYQQKSEDRPECRRVDPENTLLWKMNRQRLDFEALRDALLTVSGRLDRTSGGPPVHNTLTAQGTRRTVYAYVDRLNYPGLFRTFDVPSPDATSPQRDTTTIAPQALFFLNNPFIVECGRSTLQRPEIKAEADGRKRIGLLYRLMYGRPAAAEEVELGQDYLDKAKGTAGAWEQYVQALFLANEFVFID